MRRRGLALAVEQPAHVRVPEALDRALEAAAVAVRRVRIALPVGVRVVHAVVGHPRDDRALHGHRADDREQVLHRLVGRERRGGVSMRWKPTVTPKPQIRYISTSSARSLQSTSVFHSSTIATSTARSGTTTPIRLEIRWARVIGLDDRSTFRDGSRRLSAFPTHRSVASPQCRHCLGQRPRHRFARAVRRLRGGRRATPRAPRPGRGDDRRDRRRGARLRAGDGGRVRPRRARRRGGRVQPLRRPRGGRRRRPRRRRARPTSALGRGEFRAGRSLDALLAAYRVGRGWRGGASSRRARTAGSRPTCCTTSARRSSPTSTSCRPSRPRATRRSSPPRRARASGAGGGSCACSRRTRRPARSRCAPRRARRPGRCRAASPRWPRAVWRCKT